MTPEKKRKLRNIALLALLGLIGGTFAFTAFNQQAINDRLRENPVPVGARVHDYFNRDTENKDVFVENYGQEPIMARICLSEFMEFQERGYNGWRQVSGGSREDSRTWTRYRPESGNINNRTGDSADFTDYSTLTFGWERNDQDEPWYLPTFNHDSMDLTTAAAGDAQDYIERGATHPGYGIDNFWQANVTYTNGSSGTTWPGSTEGTRTTRQNLRQERNPVTLQQWRELPEHQQIGNFWVMDHETGWAYWANTLNAGQATSYLIDKARMEADARTIQGSYYYAIHVDSELINVSAERFPEEEVNPTEGLPELLERIREDSTGNPSPQFSAPVRDFTFGRIRHIPGANTQFTLNTPTGPQMFRYLENKGNGYHLIIRNNVIPFVSWSEQDSRINTWFNAELPADLKAMVAPVASSFTIGTGRNFSLADEGWTVTNLATDPLISNDRTEVVPIQNGGVRRAFALSLADIQRLSVENSEVGFRNNWDRSAVSDYSPMGVSWWTRTPADGNFAWHMFSGRISRVARGTVSDHHGTRPALIIHQ